MLENAKRLAGQPDTRLTDADVERIAQRVVELLRPNVEGVSAELVVQSSEEQNQQIAEMVSEKIGTQIRQLLSDSGSKRTSKAKEEA